jgi:hypothetical protein
MERKPPPSEEQLPFPFASRWRSSPLPLVPPREGECDDDDDDDEDEDNKPRRSSPTPSGRKMHHATHATRLNSTVLFIVRAMPTCIEHIRPMVQYSNVLPAFFLSSPLLLLPEEKKLARNAVGTPSNSTYTTVGVMSLNPTGPSNP